MVNASGIASILLILSATVVCGLADKQQASFEELYEKYGAKQMTPRLRSHISGNSFLQVTSGLSVKGAGGCEVCVYVVENKQMHQPFLCRGLKDPAYQQTCGVH